MKSWEVIADNLSKAGWSWGRVSAIDSNGRTIWIAAAHRDDGQRFVVHADEKLTAFVQVGADHSITRPTVKFCVADCVGPTPGGLSSRSEIFNHRSWL